MSTRARLVTSALGVVVAALSSVVAVTPATAAAATVGHVTVQGAAPPVAASSVPVKTPGNATAIQGGSIEIGIAGSVAKTDYLTLAAPCETAPAVVAFAASPGTATTTWGASATVQASSDGRCGSGVRDLLTISWSAGSASLANNVVNVLPAFDLTGVPSGSVTLDGVYVASIGVTDFTVSDLTVVNPSAAATTPISTVAPGSGDVAVGTLTVTMASTSDFVSPAYLCVTLLAPGMTTASSEVQFDTIGGDPTVTQVNASATGAFLGSSPSTTTVQATPEGGLTATAATLAFPVGSLGTGNPPVYDIQGIHVDVALGTPTGDAEVALADAPTAAGCAPANNPSSLVGGGPAFAVATNTSLAGSTAEATAALEFTTQFVHSVDGVDNCSDNNDVVLATAEDPYDALAASYLEGQLHTGVLITPPSATGAIDANTLDALKTAGVQRVYVVGGPLVVTPQEITTLQSTPAYTCGGLTTTGTDLQVIPAATTGETAVDTAVLIDNYLSGNGEGELPAPIAAAFSSPSTYDQAAGNESSAAPSDVTGTALIVSATDWQDADAAAGLAYAYHLPVILTSATSLSPQAEQELAKLGYDQVIAVGGPLALAPAVVSAIQSIKVAAGGQSTPISVLRVAGMDASGTSADLARFEGAVLGWTNATLYVAQGTTRGAGWGDSLAAAPLVGTSHGALLLTAGPSADLPSTLTTAMVQAGTAPNGLGGGVTAHLQVLGGTLAVTPAQVSQLQVDVGVG